MRRRTYLRTIGATVATGLLAGCGGDGGGSDRDENEVLVAPDTEFVFEPETLTVTADTTVTWTFLHPSHNVECDPEASDEASLPDGADPFASYEGDNRFDTNEADSTFEHDFSVPGEYDYICVPHVAQGMVGTIVVEE